MMNMPIAMILRTINAVSRRFPAVLSALFVRPSGISPGSRASE